MRQRPLRVLCTLGLFLAAWLILPGEHSTATATRGAAAVEPGGQGAVLEFDEGFAVLQQQSATLLAEIDAVKIEPPYCPPPKRTEAFAQLQKLEDEYTALQQAFTAFRLAVTKAATTPVGLKMWKGQNNPTNLHFWDGPAKDILSGPRAALDAKLKELTESKVGCPDTTSQPPPPPGGGDERGSGAGGAGAGGSGSGGSGAGGTGAGGAGVGRAGAGAAGPAAGGAGSGGASGGGGALPKGLKRPTWPDFPNLPPVPDHFCNEADRDKWLEAFESVWVAVSAAETSLRDYSADVYFAMNPAGAGAGAQGSAATLAALKAESDWAAGEEATLHALQDRLLDIRRTLPGVIDCNDRFGINSWKLTYGLSVGGKLRWDYTFGKPGGNVVPWEPVPVVPPAPPPPVPPPAPPPAAPPGRAGSCVGGGCSGGCTPTTGACTGPGACGPGTGSCSGSCKCNQSCNGGSGSCTGSCGTTGACTGSGACNGVSAGCTGTCDPTGTCTTTATTASGYVIVTAGGAWGMSPTAMNLDTGPADKGPQIIIVIIMQTTVPGLSPMRSPGPLASWFDFIEPRVFAAAPPQASSASPLQAVFVSLGTATGDTFDAHFINDDENDASIEADGVVLEAVGRDRQDRARKDWEDAVKARGADAPASTVARLSGYCGEYTKLPPVQGTIYRLADTKTQVAQADLRRVLQTEEALERLQAFTPTTDPKTFYNILRQWSIWTVAQKFSADDFAREFVAHARTNILAARQPWNATVEGQIRASVPQWWAAVSRVVTEAARAR